MRFLLLTLCAISAAYDLLCLFNGSERVSGLL